MEETGRQLRLDRVLEDLPSGTLHKAFLGKEDRLLVAKLLNGSSLFKLTDLHLPAHDSIYCAPLINIAPADEGIYLLYDCAFSTTLFSELEYKQLEFKDALGLCLEILRGLDELHSANCVHGRLHPENCLIVPGRHIKLTEYGLSPLWDEDRKFLLPYLDPLGSDERNVRSDLYAFGVLLYLIATNHLPFPIEDRADLLSRKERIPAPTGHRSSQWPADSFELIQRLVDLRPEKRFKSAAQVVKALSYFSPEGAVIVSSSKERQPKKKLESDPRKFGFVYPDAGKRRFEDRANQIWFVLFVLLVTASIFYGAYLFWPRHGKSEPDLIKRENKSLLFGKYVGKVVNYPTNGGESPIEVNKSLDGFNITFPGCSAASVDEESGYFSCAGDAILTVLGQRGSTVYGFITKDGRELYWEALVTAN